MKFLRIMFNQMERIIWLQLYLFINASWSKEGEEIRLNVGLAEQLYL